MNICLFRDSFVLVWIHLVWQYAYNTDLLNGKILSLWIVKIFVFYSVYAIPRRSGDPLFFLQLLSEGFPDVLQQKSKFGYCSYLKVEKLKNLSRTWYNFYMLQACRRLVFGTEKSYILQLKFLQSFRVTQNFFTKTSFQHAKFSKNFIETRAEVFQHCTDIFYFFKIAHISTRTSAIILRSADVPLSQKFVPENWRALIFAVKRR